MAESDNAHLFFAKKLASNDLELRTSTLKNLATFFGKSGVLTEPDFAKIWMGLWYAMWMSDKPKVQRELAESISNLIHTHNNVDNAIMFIKVFFKTVHREFPKIDRLRYDKFLKFVRIFVHHSFLYIKNKDYDLDIIDKFHKALTVTWDMDDAQEIQIHVCDLFFEELYISCGSAVPKEALFKHASLFMDTLEKTNHGTLKERVFEALRTFIDAANYCSPKLAPKNRRGLDNNKDMFPDLEFIAIDLEELEDWFLKRASKQGTFLNRDIMYDLYERALKKRKAEPGFKLLPRGSIMKKMAQAEEEEYKRLMEEYQKSKEGEEPEPKSKKELKREKRKAAEMAKEAENGHKEEQKEETPNKKIKKNKKASSPSPSTPSTPQTTVTVLEEVKKNAKGEVVSKKKETTETKVTSDGKSKVTEITTTTEVKEVKKGGKQGGKKEEKEQEQEVAPAPQAKQAKAKPAPPASPANGKTNDKKRKEPEASPSTPVVNGKASEKNEKKRKASEGEQTPNEVPNGKAAKGKKGEKKEEAVVPEVAKEETTPKGHGKGKAEGKKEEKGKKGKAVPETVEVAMEEETTPKGKGKGKKEEKGKKGGKVVEEVPEETTPKGKGKKGGKKEEKVPATPASLKKSVRFSRDDLIKEFDKSTIIGTPTASPATTPVKLKSLLTPPSNKMPKK